MKSLTGKNKTGRNIEEGVWVYLKLQPYSDKVPTTSSQLIKYYGPFKFHVSQLKLLKIIDRRLGSCGLCASGVVVSGQMEVKKRKLGSCIQSYSISNLNLIKIQVQFDCGKSNSMGGETQVKHESRARHV
ncbi:hypothetical protein Tco_1005598 [Tanacetum coccineum]|uniref:Uncharacterized protein n=1 Tax=Tanacetum coccineum TaxID=301880 RepID=A0ABQ5FFB3_9ASTR